ncbi:POP1 ribonuclease P/MRP subunit [Carabus blaptoides fortunei]
MATSQILSERRNKLVTDNIVPLDTSAIPVMLVQQPGTRNSTNHLGYCSGWDIISPSNWGRPLWLSLIMWGGRAGGIRESHMLKFEQGRPDFLQPDTKAGETEENRVSNLYKEKFFNLPPNKRVNYTKLGIVSPFTFAWKTLIGEWNLQPKPIHEFYVLRDRKKIQNLQELLKYKNMDFQNGEVNFADNCLVPVALSLLKRGNMKKFSIICLPEECDLKNKNEPVEPLHKDENQTIRKDLRVAHQKLLKRLRKRRVRAKATGKVVFVEILRSVVEWRKNFKNLAIEMNW